MTTVPLRLGGVPEHFNLPWHLAIESPACADLALTWQDQPGGTGQMLARLADGDLDMVSILTEGTVAAIDDGAPITIVQVYVTSPLQWGVFVRPDSRYHQPADLADGQARIAISRFNSGSHLMAFILAEPRGWSPDPDRFVVTGGIDGAVEAFGADEADLFLWEQHMTRPLVDAGVFDQIGVVETPWPSFVIAARNEILTGRTTEAGRVIDEVVAQAQALHARPEVAQEIAGRYSLTVETAQSWLDTTTYAPRAAMDPTISTKVLDTLTGAGFR
jgi:ABC-type nitrate/sulfonate/bicarbonate transport system substrate-binding protein